LNYAVILPDLEEKNIARVVPPCLPPAKGSAIMYRGKEIKFMKVIAINGSPRKKWNTATLLEKTLDGAASRGADTELVHLYDLSYKGCISCFTCKPSICNQQQKR